MKSIAIFCGASSGHNPVYQEAAQSLGTLFAQKGIRLVYGGGNVGLMGVMADAVLAGGGEVVGVIPQSLVEMEVAHKGLTHLHVVQTMHERKALMAAESDAFVAMPGGFGTFDEFCEIVTWNQLRIIQKPAALYNVNGYFDHFLQMLRHSVTEGFLKPENFDNLIISNQENDLLDQLLNHSPVITQKWVDFKRI
ncbi:TIGR00730 family Rossman fold protein [Rufibacter glacialis]|uniref:Cytokinin riboside 5'-monophosphate phosphoribohydrolase n=1 Tax=Rufibacter glacialis TaxID=1259555 RepID=A0A5M8Q8G7_9BACT|nr:TIGR00730 family Rossman fold protein [Rufibacter glacialis]KAA6431120.1 TIGR00730 family Rossman fold protein [Rufibacter glacialis]GGK84205.1 putative cytokinin riboside 5'-monophosphate phosphoribohydrolase [Rufibacter glacialis]